MSKLLKYKAISANFAITTINPEEILPEFKKAGNCPLNENEEAEIGKWLEENRQTPGAAKTFDMHKATLYVEVLEVRCLRMV